MNKFYTLIIACLLGTAANAQTLVSIGSAIHQTSPGVLDSVGKKVMVAGTVYGLNTRYYGLSFTLNDGTGGIQLYSGSHTFGYTVNEGDSIQVIGQVSNYNGLAELTCDTTRGDTIIKVGTGALRSPVIVTSLGENTESYLVQMDSLHFISQATKKHSINVTVANSTGTQFLVRVDSITDLYAQVTTVFTGTFNVVGLGGQYTTTAPYNSGYQLFPRNRADIHAVVTGINEINNQLSFNLYPNPAKTSLTINVGTEIKEAGTIRVLDLTGREVMNQVLESNINTINVSNLEQGAYIVQVKAGNFIGNKQFNVIR